jgi:predicted nucleic acid-binding OB-fold protein
MDKYEKLCEFNTEFYSSIESIQAKIIEEEFLNYLRGKKMEYTLNPRKYKLKFFDSLDDEKEKVEICMKILKVNDEKVCI